MTASIFITGTDTAVGKTLAATALMHALRKCGKQVAGFKPVSAGCKTTSEGLRNDDAVQLQQAASAMLPYELVNPYAFEPPIAPHIAAQEQGIEISLDRIVDCHERLANQADVVIIEGAGGWLVPLNHTQTMADVARSIASKVIMVVDMKLGCLNHALLTAGSIADSGMTLDGWIANSTKPRMSMYEQNLDTLVTRLNAPLLAQIDFAEAINPAMAMGTLDLDTLYLD